MTEDTFSCFACRKSFPNQGFSFTDEEGRPSQLKCSHGCGSYFLNSGRLFSGYGSIYDHVCCPPFQVKDGVLESTSTHMIICDDCISLWIVEKKLEAPGYDTSCFVCNRYWRSMLDSSYCMMYDEKMNHIYCHNDDEKRGLTVEETSKLKARKVQVPNKSYWIC